MPKPDEIELVEGDEVIEEQPGADILGMSDEEFMEKGSALEPAPAVKPAAVVEPDPDGTEGDVVDTEAKPAVPAKDAKVPVIDDKKVVPPVDPKAKAEPAAKDPVVEPVVVPVDYEAQFKKLTAPFDANGKKMQVDNVDDAIRLMQMGANYNKKMAGLKPSLKVLKLLENNGLLDEGKLNFLIDLDKKDPKAITQLLKDSKIEPLDLDIKADTTYKPTARTVDDRELELDSVISEIKDSPHFAQTLDVVSTKWDAKSRQFVANEPQIIKTINSHIASGVYGVITTALDKQRILGTLNGLSDLEAYRKVGDDIEAAGGFAHLFPTEPVKAAVAPVVPVVAKKLADPAALNDKRRAAGGSKSAAPTADKQAFNPLGLSDEEFSKQFDGKLM